MARDSRDATLRPMMRWCIALLLLCAAHAGAQVRCVMPNGVTVQFELAKNCPSGAVSGETLDGKPIAVQPRPVQVPAPKPRASAKAPPVPVPAPTPAPEKPALSEVDEADALCRVLRVIGASECDVDLGIFRGNRINATMALAISEVASFCPTMGHLIRKSYPALRRSPRGWRLNVYSPFGAGTRPIAVCDL